MDNHRMLDLNKIYDEARRFLVSKTREKVPGYDAEVLIDQYLSLPDKSQEPIALEQVYQRLLESAQNAGMKNKVIGDAIGGIGNLSCVLQGFNPHQVLNDYGNDYEKLLNKIEQELKPTGQFRTASRSLWPGYCKTVLSAARFFSQFASGKDFYDWALHFYRDKRSRAALPLVLSEEIYGIGYPLACDFLKELGFIEYGKPDVHICQIFVAIGLCHKTATPYEIQKIIGQIADTKGVSAYNADKLFWLIGSGHFYNHADIGVKGKIGRMKKDFIERVNKESNSGVLTELVFSCGCEGGQIKLYRRCTPNGTLSFFTDCHSINIDENDDEFWESSERSFDSWNAAWAYLVKEQFYFMYPLKIHPEYRRFFRDYLYENQKTIIGIMPSWLDCISPRWSKLLNES